MPKVKMDYSNTIIYKIFCKDTNIKGSYIGHTTNFVKRKSAHKTSCKDGNFYIYRYIREHGGWDNWKIIILDDIDCKNYEEARKVEQSYIDLHNSELNTTNAYCVKDKKENTEKEYNENDYTYKEYKEYKEYVCKCCDYKCSNKTNFEKHLHTQKHKKQIIEISGNVVVEKPVEHFACENCEKVFKTNSGLWKHRNKNICKEVSQKNTGISTELLAEVLQKHSEANAEMMKNTVVSIMKEMAPQMGNNNTTNSNNTQFNINVFLNEECKNAINMSDFIKSIEVSLAQLDLTKRCGLEKGITQVIMDNMNKLSIYERPLHCTDTKRETLYIKDQDKWSKDNNKMKMKEVIKKTQNKNYSALVEWTRENPNFMKDDSKQMFYAKAISQVGKCIDDVDDKIIKQVCKQTYVKDEINMLE